MKELLEQAIGGDAVALREIYSKYNKAVYYFCLKLMANQSDAAEMCAETFDCAFARLDSLENPEQFDIWLKNIAAIRCYNSIHKQKPMLFLQAVADTEECLFSVSELEEMPQGELEETRTCQLMDKMLDRLNDAQRMTLMFHYYNGLSVVQIAKVMSCTADIVKQRMEKAAEHMKNTIAALGERGIVLGLMAACHSVPQFVDAQVEGIIISISGETVEEPAAPTPQYNFESFATREPEPAIAEEISEEDDSTEPSLKELEVTPIRSRMSKKKKGNAFFKKVKSLSSMQQSVALVLIVAIIAVIIIGVGMGKKSENPDLAPPSNVSSEAVSSETSSVEIVIPKQEVTFETLTEEVKASDGKAVARATYQLPTVELTENPAAAIKINEFFETEKQNALAAYSDKYVQQECIYGYENAPHGPWQLNETKFEMTSGKVNEATVNLCKTKTEFKYGNVFAQTEVEAYCFSSVSGERLTLDDVMKDKDAYLNYAANKIRENLERNQSAGKYNLYTDYSTTVREVLEKQGRWYFTDKGITVIFNPDEVVYITLGVQTVELPMTEINGFLNTEYIK